VYSSAKRIRLSGIGFMQGSSALPTDVTLKLSDGSIAAHKMLLAAVSPVFRAMFYGDFKEANATEVEIPDKKLKIMQMLFDAVFQGSCEIDSLDDIVPLMEVADYYQIEKKPLQEMCGEAVIKQFETNKIIDTELLSKFATVMSEQSIKRMADMILNIMKNKFTELYSLPEKVLYHLLQRDDIDCEEVEIFKYLYLEHIQQQAKPSKITASLFAQIRYSLIPPQFLLTEVTKCDLVDKQQVHKAIEDIYTDCTPLGENGGDDYKSFGQYPRMPNYSLKIDWCLSCGTTEQASISCRNDEYNVQFSLNKGYLHEILYSPDLENGIYSFAVTYNTSLQKKEIIYLRIIGKSELLSTTPISSGCIITMNNQDGCLFLKVIDGQSQHHRVKSTATFCSKPPIFFTIINGHNELHTTQNMYYSFNIIPAHTYKLRRSKRSLYL